MYMYMENKNEVGACNVVSHFTVIFIIASGDLETCSYVPLCTSASTNT